MNDSIAKQLSEPVITKRTLEPVITRRIPGLEPSGVRVHGILTERLTPTMRLGLGGQGVFGQLTVDGTCVVVPVPDGKEGTEGWESVLIPLSRFAGIAILK